jgi:hypothetical protein
MKNVILRYLVLGTLAVLPLALTIVLVPEARAQSGAYLQCLKNCGGRQACRDNCEKAENAGRPAPHGTIQFHCRTNPQTGEQDCTH